MYHLPDFARLCHLVSLNCVLYHFFSFMCIGPKYYSLYTRDMIVKLFVNAKWIVGSDLNAFLVQSNILIFFRNLLVDGCPTTFHMIFSTHMKSQNENSVSTFCFCLMLPMNSANISENMSLF